MTALFGVLGAVLPFGLRAIKQLLQLRRLDSVAVDKTGTKVTITGHRDDRVVLDVTNDAEADKLKDYLNRYDSSSGR
ncbi:hypothetical protein [Streptomyces sp. NPDC006333]|uniref:hypothetical protein n=1 Tax=Streptomyces sp. NPDC006333 TaxID=3156753 RepID=UPI0033AB5753